MRTFIQTQILLVAVVFAFSVSASAKSKSAPKIVPVPAATPAATNNQNSDKVDVTDIEQKYWASKDTDFSVVQNRLYPKAKRYAVSASIGPLVADPNSTGSFYVLDASYYFNEREGVALTYSIGDIGDNENAKELRDVRGVAADHNRPKQFIGASYVWVPVYAKASFLNSKIFYFDFSISGGLGAAQYIQQIEAGNITKTAPAASIDFCQQFFFSKHFAVRADYRHKFYNAHVVNWRPSASSPAYDKIKLQHDQEVTFGATFFF